MLKPKPPREWQLFVFLIFTLSHSPQEKQDSEWSHLKTKDYPLITVIDLNYARCSAPFLSEELLEKMHETLTEDKKILLFFNRRGSARTLVCSDCSHQFLCPRCDVAFNIHTTPKKRLLCHHCSLESPLPHSCPKCHGSNLKGIGFGIQKIEESLRAIFPGRTVVRIDSDKKRSEGIFEGEVALANILLSTELGNTLAIENIGLVAFLMIESELMVSEYNIEEKIYTNIAYNLRRGSDAILQTYIPKSDLVQNLADGNYRDFAVHTLAERKKFSYPPYRELVHVWVRDRSRERIRDIIYKLCNKLELLKTPETELYFDKELFSKRADEYAQKIVLKGTNLEALLSEIKGEIFRNRGVSVEWK